MFEFLYNGDKLLTFMFAVIRIGSMIHTAPIFGSMFIKAQVKMALSVMLGVVLFQYITPVTLSELDPTLLILLMIKEILIGIAVGFILRLIFLGVQFGAQFIDFQMGLSMVNVMDPQSQTSISLMGQALNIVMILIFLALNGHHIVLRAIAETFLVIPLGKFIFHPNAYLYISQVFAEIFVIALKITAPVFITLMAHHATMGFMGRLVPQLNILIVGLPIQIAVGLTILTLSMGFFYTIFEKLMDKYLKEVLVLFNYLGS